MFRLGVFILPFLLLLVTEAEAEVFFTRNYLSGVTLGAGEVEVTGEALLMNDSVDLLNLRASRLSDSQDPGTGDLEGGRLMLSYGLSDQLLLVGGYTYRELSAPPIGDVGIGSYHLSLVRRIPLRHYSARHESYIYVAIGGSYDQCEDYRMTSAADIDFLVKRVDPDYSVTSAPGRIDISNGELTLSSPLLSSDGTLKPELAVGLQDSSDQTVFFRAGIGRRWDRFNAALFAEVGRQWTDGALDHNFSLYGVDDDDLPSGFDPDLSNQENYAQTGIDLYYETRFGVAAHLGYAYLWLDRDDDSGGVNDNHVLKADLSFRFNHYLAWTLGGEYYRHQFNGVIPLLYNRYTASTFDRDYGLIHTGLTVKFGH